MSDSQVEDMLEYAEFLVWAYEVDTGFVDCEAAAELIEGYWLMYVPSDPAPLHNFTLAERAIATSPSLYALFLERQR